MNRRYIFSTIVDSFIAYNKCTNNGILVVLRILLIAEV